MTFNTLKEKLPFLDSFVTVAPISLENEKIYHDARSAAFFAMGRTMKEKTTVGLALPGAYLASTYTAITEAWFQKVNVVVFAFYDKLSEVSTAWIDRCIVKSMTIGADEIDDSIDEIESCCGMNGPVLINIVGVKDDETSFDYRKWIDAIRQKEGNAKIRCYNAIQSDGIINIPSTEHWQICIDGMINDGYHCLKNVFEMKPEEFFERVNVYADTVNNGEYAVRWKKRMDIVHFPELGFTNLAVIKEFCKTIPDNSLLHTTVLDSIRMSNYVEMKPSIRCFANIGADGIDGALSTYLGQGESEEKPVYLLIGDLSLMYDMNALLQKLPHNIRIVVINNYSGAEFHKNFGLDRIPTLNKHIAAGHRVKIANCCINSQFKYLAATNMEEVREALTILNTESEKPILLEVFTDADKDAKILKSYWMTNRQEIPGMKLSGKARVKQIVRNILGNKAYAIREMFKK